MDDSGKPPTKPRERLPELRVEIPAEWLALLHEAADAQAISLSALVRIVLRGFLRERLAPEERARLEVRS